MSKDQGGRKKPHDPKLRQEAIRLAERVGASEAGWRLKVPPGTVRSWMVRARRRRLSEEDADTGLERLKEAGRKMLAEWEAKEAAERAAQRPEEPE